MEKIKQLIKRNISVIDILLTPFIYPAAFLLKIVRLAGVQRLPHCKKALIDVGVFPIRNHYYEPQFDNGLIDFSQDRNLPGINWNVSCQLELLERFAFSNEIQNIPKEKGKPLEFFMNNGSFGFGDADYWYQIIRTLKPERIIEIGSGHSTLMAIKAIGKNYDDNSNYKCEHICIEPYEMPLLEETGVTVIREKVEDIALTFFSKLKENDILFIDSSHIIRPQGDVLFEYLELLPSLNKGVVVHIHDIFSPKNYKKQWLQDNIWFWNEQYLLEAFLSHNRDWKIIGALNYLHNKHYKKLKSVAPFLKVDPEPGSFYIQKIN